MQVNYDLIETVAGEILSDIPDKWFAENWDCGLGSVFSEWPKACAVTRPAQEAFEASRITRSNVPGATLRNRVLRLSETATLIVGF